MRFLVLLAWRGGGSDGTARVWEVQCSHDDLGLLDGMEHHGALL